MARQNSKYFSSVIEKLIADKHKENIVIDQGFKARLREDVLARAKMMDVPESSASNGIGEFFARWKYALAFVPSALLVIVVAAQLMNMPVNMDSDVVVPQGTGVEENGDESMVQTDEDKEAEASTDSENEDSERGDMAASVLDSEEKVGDSDKDLIGGSEDADNETEPGRTLKTFPGSLVLPADTVGEVSNTAVDEYSNDSTESEAKTAVAGVKVSPVEEAVSEVSESSQVTMPTMREPVIVPGAQVPYRVNEPEEKYKEFDYIDRNDKEDDAEGSDLKVVNTESLKVIESGSVDGDGIGGGVDDNGDNAGNGDVVDEGSDDLVPISAPVLVDVPVKSVVDVPTGGLDVKVDNLVPVDAQTYKVSYETSLSDAEKRSLEDNVLDSIDERKDVERVVVARNADGYVKVTAYFEGGGSETQILIFNFSTKLWDKVNYVAPVKSVTPVVYKTYRVEY